MKLTCEPEALLGVLALLKPAVPSRPRVPILANVLLSAVGDRVRVGATDLGLGITCSLPAQVEQAGAVTVPFARLHKVIERLSRVSRGGVKRRGAQREPSPATAVELEVTPCEHILSVNSGHVRARIVGAAAEDFPVLPTLEQIGAGERETLLQLDLPLLCAMVEQVACAADHRTEWVRPHPPGYQPLHSRVLLQVMEGKIVLAARDLGCMAISEAAMMGTGMQSCTLILPAGNLVKVVSLLEETREQPLMMAVALGTEQRRVLFHTPGLDIVSYVPEQEFLDFGHLIPAAEGPWVEVQRAALAAALDFVEYVANRNGGEIRLQTQPDSGALLVEARGDHLGEQSTEIEILSAVKAVDFGCGPSFWSLKQLVAASRATTLLLEWHAQADTRSGTLVVRSLLPELACKNTYVVPQTRAVTSLG